LDFADFFYQSSKSARPGSTWYLEKIFGGMDFNLCFWMPVIKLPSQLSQKNRAIGVGLIRDYVFGLHKSG
jgi:hypothetical protein